MGKPFRQELAELPRTYLWAMQQKLDLLESSLSALGRYPLLVVGSGGSFSAGHFMAYLHQHFTQRIAKAVTPLDLSFAPIDFRRAGVAFLTAGGRNPDVLGSLRGVLTREPSNVLVLCFRSGGPLAKIAAHYPAVSLIENDLPSGKDGFLATNTLLASAVLLSRAYGSVFARGAELPGSLEELLHPGESSTDFMSNLRSRCGPLWDRDTIIVLHGSATQPAALDLESKFTEAALQHVQVCDYRNFAHGRHYWLASRGGETAIAALVSDEDREIAKKTLDLIPPKIPVVRLDVKHRGPTAGVAGLALVVYVVGVAAEASDSDPGRPRVPVFGRRLYRLNVLCRKRNDGSGIGASEMIAIERKSGSSVSVLSRAGEMSHWRDAYQRFLNRLREATFGAVVFDYDGTLCDPMGRFDPLGQDVVRHLQRLLRSRLLIGIATGRGKSVRNELRKAIPEAYWRQVLIGYYNASDIGLLDNDSVPDKDSPMNPALLKVRSLLESDAFLTKHAEIECRPNQISLEPGIGSHDMVQRWLLDHTAAFAGIGVKALESSHSFDILPVSVSKLSLVSACRGLLKEGGKPDLDVLCIGDKGSWPGNDCELLSSPYSLSVDEVSSDGNACWNLSCAGRKGVGAAIEYMASFRLLKCKFRYSSALNA